MGELTELCWKQRAHGRAIPRKTVLIPRVGSCPTDHFLTAADGFLNHMMRTMHGSETANDRRRIQRFRVRAPLTVFAGDREIPAYTRDLSNRGVYFYLAPDDSQLLELDFDFLVELPPEITLSTFCRIRCHGRTLRKEKTLMSLTGVAAEIVDYSILNEAVSRA